MSADPWRGDPEHDPRYAEAAAAGASRAELDELRAVIESEHPPSAPSGVLWETADGVLEESAGDW